MGFQPRDREIWYPLGGITTGQEFCQSMMNDHCLLGDDGKPEWGVGDWHEGEGAQADYRLIVIVI